MKIKIKSSTLQNINTNLVKAKLGSLGSYDYSRRFQITSENVVEVDLESCSLKVLEIVYDTIVKAEDAYARRVKQLINSVKAGPEGKVLGLKLLPDKFTQFFEGRSSLWLFSNDESLPGVAYLIKDIEYRPADGRNRYSNQVHLILVANIQGYLSERRIILGDNDCNGYTVEDIISNLGFYVADEELLATYEKIQEKYIKYSEQVGEQFWVRGVARSASRRDWWSFLKTTSQSLTVKGKPSRAVCLPLYGESVVSDEEENSNREHKFLVSSLTDGTTAKKQPVPRHPMLKLFSLHAHQDYWVHVHNMRPYKYEKDIEKKLILPPSHMSLINALVSNLEALATEAEAEDKSRIIRAKASSSVILCKGVPGTGKTLTCEIYSEKIQRPMYEIQSGQIGTEPEEIETNLSKILERATNLRMPLLINEADVFIQERGNDVKQNAIVSVFLRLLEYHNGLIFLTSNRSKAIDDAILSRCLAIIDFPIPEEEQREGLWKMLLAEFNYADLTPKANELAKMFPTASGRDIQNLIRLAARVAIAENKPLIVSLLKTSSVFRGLKIAKKDN